MHVISEKMLRDFWAIHPDAEAPLRAWLRNAEQAEWESFTDVRELYSTASHVGKFTVFNIGGNKYRLITTIPFNRGKVYVRDILTHKDYDEDSWKKG